MIETQSSCDLSEKSLPGATRKVAGKNSGAVKKIWKICKFSELGILMVAAKGNLEEFQRLYYADNTRLNIQDSKGLTACHRAAANGRVNILEFISSQGGDLSIQDKYGNTPLHHAVSGSHIKTIDYLLDNNVDSSILNDKNMAPIHLAVERNAIEALKTLLEHDNVDPNVKGEKGSTALHYCAAKDRHKCAKLLLENGARPNIKCDNGFFPINVAGKCGSAKTLEILIRHVEKLGYKREDILTLSDKENNMPLHCAVNSGDLAAVLVCLNAGAPVDAKQEDQSTPLHFACAIGSVDMVKLMHDKQPDRFETAMQTEDILQMTPLHRAALFDHATVVEYLIQLRADVNVQDIDSRTPLLLASSKGGWKTVDVLLRNGADVSIKDKDNRNFLHLLIRNGGGIDKLGCEVIQKVKDLLNERDDFGCTPLHYASKEGRLNAIDDLLRLGAKINLKDNKKKSPLHFAAKYGRYNTCKRLLESVMGPNIINETDCDGSSALHIAAENGQTKIITLLMQKGAYVTRNYGRCSANGDKDILHLLLGDDKDNSPLHLASANGYTKSMRLLLQVYPNLLDQGNKNGDTALHVASRAGHAAAVELLLCFGAEMKENAENLTFFDIAIQEKHIEVGLAIVRHERWEEALNLFSSLFYTPMNGLVQFLPEVSLAALDRCITAAKIDNKSKDFFIQYNFRYLQCPGRLKEEKDRNNDVPMLVLNTMVRHSRVQCLSHPLSEAYLNMKWRAYGAWFHILNFIIYAIFLALLTILVTTCSFRFIEKEMPCAAANNTTTCEYFDSDAPKKKISVESCEPTTIHRICVLVLLVFCCLNMIKEVLQMIQQKVKYFLDQTNYLEWILYVSTVLFVVPFMITSTPVWQWMSGAIAVFLAWFNCLLFFRRFDFFGIYVVMFLEILRTLLQVLCVFSILLIAFGMAFFMLMNKEASAAYSTVGLSLLRTAMMMLELDYMASFNEPFTDNDPSTLYYGETVIFLLACFVLLMPILLMNLLIGLAVGDINSVQDHATLKRLAMQVELHTDLERKLPAKIIDMVDKTEYKYYPNRCTGFIQQFWSKLSFSGDAYDYDGNAALKYQEHVYEEIYKLKHRMKDLSDNMSKQHDLLRLIVRKMEIQTEDENRDEGGISDTIINPVKMPVWSPTTRNLVRQSAVVTAWRNSMENVV